MSFSGLQQVKPPTYRFGLLTLKKTKNHVLKCLVKTFTPALQCLNCYLSLESNGQQGEFAPSFINQIIKNSAVHCVHVYVVCPKPPLPVQFKDAEELSVNKVGLICQIKKILFRSTHTHVSRDSLASEERILEKQMANIRRLFSRECECPKLNNYHTQQHKNAQPAQSKSTFCLRLQNQWMCDIW